MLSSDSTYSRLMYAARQCFVYHTQSNRVGYTRQLQQLWSPDHNPNPVLPCLCVRTAFDLFLQVKNFPQGSEVIMTAINIRVSLLIGLRGYKTQYKSIPIRYSLHQVNLIYLVLTVSNRTCVCVFFYIMCNISISNYVIACMKEITGSKTTRRTTTFPNIIFIIMYASKN